MKRGFTLAEMLITLGIIGVVAALTAPSLVQNAGSAQVGPKLAKAVSTFEVANENLLTVEGSNSLMTITNPLTSGSGFSNYIDSLSNYMKISYFDQSNLAEDEKYSSLLKNYHGNKRGAINTGGAQNFGIVVDSTVAPLWTAISKDGILYCFGVMNTANTAVNAHKKLIGMVIIDVNGLTKPNRLGKDAFAFSLMADGSLRPVGSLNWTEDDTDNSTYNWKNGTKDLCNETTVTSGWTCAGAIFENNLKVNYQ